MKEVKMHGKEKLLSDLKKVGDMLDRPVRIYLIGGCAMALRDLKSATKDVDAIFISPEELKLFEQKLISIGYEIRVKVEEEYKQLGTYSILRNDGNAGFDLFLIQVCEMLVLSESMIKRAEKYGEFNKLEVFLLANEDITLFKGITERPKDIDDIASLVKGSLQKDGKFNWDFIKEECSTQAEHLKIEGHLYNRFLELFEKYQIKTPLLSWLRKKDIDHLLEEAYGLRIAKGLSHEQIVEQFKKDGFNKREMAKIESFKKEK
jgi:hypothetical protein